jgi:hypothetical protein
MPPTSVVQQKETYGYHCENIWSKYANFELYFKRHAGKVGPVLVKLHTYECMYGNVGKIPIILTSAMTTITDLLYDKTYLPSGK